jgi:hypothetical protein
MNERERERGRGSYLQRSARPTSGGGDFEGEDVRRGGGGEGAPSKEGGRFVSMSVLVEKERRVDGRKDRWTDGRKNERSDRWTDESIKGRTDGRKDGRTEE